MGDEGHMKCNENKWEKMACCINVYAAFHKQ